MLSRQRCEVKPDDRRGRSDYTRFETGSISERSRANT